MFWKFINCLEKHNIFWEVFECSKIEKKTFKELGKLRGLFSRAKGKYWNV